jgi:hypothetical protein
MENSFVQQAGFTQTDQRRDRQLIVIRIALEMVRSITQLLTEQTNIIFDFRAFRTLSIIKTIYAASLNQF